MIYLILNMHVRSLLAYSFTILAIAYMYYYRSDAGSLIYHVIKAIIKKIY